MAIDIDLGNSNIEINSTRFIFRLDWNRDRGSKEEKMLAFVTQTNKNTANDKVISKDTYLVTLTDAVLNSCRGHNIFLTDLRNLLNQTLNEYINSGSVMNLETGSVQLLS